MPIEFEIKVVKVGNSLRITIPKQIADWLKIRAGDTVRFSVSDNEIIVRKITKQ